MLQDVPDFSDEGVVFSAASRYNYMLQTAVGETCAPRAGPLRVNA